MGYGQDKVIFYRWGLDIFYLFLVLLFVMFVFLLILAYFFERFAIFL